MFYFWLNRVARHNCHYLLAPFSFPLNFIFYLSITDNSIFIIIYSHDLDTHFTPFTFGMHLLPKHHRGFSLSSRFYPRLRNIMYLFYLMQPGLPLLHIKVSSLWSRTMMFSATIFLFPMSFPRLPMLL